MTFFSGYTLTILTSVFCFHRCLPHVSHCKMVTLIGFEPITAGEIFSIMMMWFVSDLLSPITVMPIHLRASKRSTNHAATHLKVCVDVSTWANNGHFFASSLYTKFLFPPCIGQIFLEGSTSCDVKKPERHGAVGAAWFLRSHNKNAPVEKMICPCDRTQLSFFYDRISKLIKSVHLLTHECMGEVWRAQEKRNRWLYCVLS